ncbi:MAG: thioredoxin domain-containing protein [Nanoarchaeota archaeon]
MAEAIEATKESGTITIKKDSLWKYSTFILLAALVIGGFFFFRGSGGGNGGTTDGGSTGQVDLSPFLQNAQFYPSLGPEDASNVVIEFSDFQCPYCAMASGLPSWTSQYSDQYPDLIGSAGKIQDMAKNGDLRFIYVSMSFLGQESVYASEAGLCANEQGKFWEMHDKIFGSSDAPSENTGKYSVVNLEKLAAGISGLDKTKFNDCLDSGKYESAVQSIAAQASKAASGTPTFYVNGKKVSGSWAQISAALA